MNVFTDTASNRVRQFAAKFYRVYLMKRQAGNGGSNRNLARWPTSQNQICKKQKKPRARQRPPGFLALPAFTMRRSVETFETVVKFFRIKFFFYCHRDHTALQSYLTRHSSD